MKKRLLAMVLAVVMVLAVGPMPASAAFSARSTDPGINNTTYTSGNPYPKKQCTWYAWGRYKELCGVELPKWGDGQNWYSKAKSAGYSVGDEPKLGAIACWESWNHVAIVEKIESGNIYVSQYNRKGEEKFGGLDKYSNGSEKKDASGNNIWTAWEMMGVKGSRKGKAGGTPSYYIYLKEDSATVKTTITFNLVTPSSFTVGTDIALDGSMSATGSKINSVKVEIVNAANGSVVLSASSSGNFSVETYGPLVAKNSKLNSDLDLGKLPVGTYYARFTVGTKDGATASEETGRFNVNPISCNGNHTRGGYLGSADTHPHWVYWKCAICGERYTEWGVETKDTCEICNPQPDCSNGHTWGEWETVEKADCENDGKQRRICSVCGEREEERIAAPGHNYRLTNSTATEETYTCSRCGGSYKKPIGSGGSEINGGGSCLHQWSDWNVYEYCDMEGRKSRYCKKCGEREEQPLPATGHDWRLDSDGYYRCTRCLKTNYERGKVGTDQGDDQMYFPDWNEIEHKNAVEVCTDLEIIRGLPNGYFDPERNIDRASWAKMVFCITTGRVSEGDYASEYVDMYCNLTDIQGCWAEGFIKYLTVADVVSGNGSGKYQPWSSVTVVEAAKTMLTTLGYDAQDRGYVNNVAWDTNIMADARRIGLMDGIDQQPKDELNRDNAAQMIYNALRCNTQCFFNGSYTEGDTLLRSVFHIGAIVFD